MDACIFVIKVYFLGCHFLVCFCFGVPSVWYRNVIGIFIRRKWGVEACLRVQNYNGKKWKANFLWFWRCLASLKCLTLPVFIGENFIFMYHNSLHIMKGSISEDDREKNYDLRSKTDYGQRVKIVLHAICKKDSAISLSEQ